MTLWIAVPVLSVLGLVAERMLFGPLAIAGQGPDLLLVALLALVSRHRHAAAGGCGFGLGLIRDVFGAGHPGTFALTYLVAALVLVELGQVVRIPSGIYRAGLAGLASMFAGLVLAILGWATAGVSPSVTIGPVLISSAYTALAAGLMLWGADNRA